MIVLGLWILQKLQYMLNNLVWRSSVIGWRSVARLELERALRRPPSLECDAFPPRAAVGLCKHVFIASVQWLMLEFCTVDMIANPRCPCPHPNFCDPAAWSRNSNFQCPVVKEYRKQSPQQQNYALALPHRLVPYSSWLFLLEVWNKIDQAGFDLSRSPPR